MPGRPVAKTRRKTSRKRKPKKSRGAARLLKPGEKKIHEYDLPSRQDNLDIHPLKWLIFPTWAYPPEYKTSTLCTENNCHDIEVESNLYPEDRNQIVSCTTIPVFIAGTVSAHSPVIIFSHGNGEALYDPLMENALDMSHAIGLPVVAYDFCGYGRSVGKTTEENSYKSILAVSNWLAKTFDVPTTKQCIVGFSLGTAISTYLAVKRQCAALVLIAPFSSITEIYAGDVPGLNMFRTKDIIAKVQCPILMLHGKADRAISYKQTEKLENIAVKARRDTSKKIFDNMKHWYDFTDWDLGHLYNHIKDFLLRKLSDEKVLSDRYEQPSDSLKKKLRPSPLLTATLNRKRGGKYLPWEDTEQPQIRLSRRPEDVQKLARLLPNFDSSKINVAITGDEWGFAQEVAYALSGRGNDMPRPPIKKTLSLKMVGSSNACLWSLLPTNDIERLYLGGFDIVIVVIGARLTTFDRDAFLVASSLQKPIFHVRTFIDNEEDIASCRTQSQLESRLMRHRREFNEDMSSQSSHNKLPHPQFPYAYIISHNWWLERQKHPNRMGVLQCDESHLTRDVERAIQILSKTLP